MKTPAILSLAILLSISPQNATSSVQLNFDSTAFGGVQIIGVSSDLSSLYKEATVIAVAEAPSPTAIAFSAEIVGPASRLRFDGEPVEWAAESRRVTIPLPLGVVPVTRERLGDARLARLWISEVVLGDGRRYSRDWAQAKGRLKETSNGTRDCVPSFFDLARHVWRVASVPGFNCEDSEHNLYCFNNDTSCRSELCWTDGGTIATELCHFKICSITPSALPEHKTTTTGPAIAGHGISAIQNGGPLSTRYVATEPLAVHRR